MILKLSALHMGTAYGSVFGWIQSLQVRFVSRSGRTQSLWIWFRSWCSRVWTFWMRCTSSSKLVVVVVGGAVSVTISLPGSSPLLSWLFIHVCPWLSFSISSCCGLVLVVVVVFVGGTVSGPMSFPGSAPLLPRLSLHAGPWSSSCPSVAATCPHIFALPTAALSTPSTSQWSGGVSASRAGQAAGGQLAGRRRASGGRGQTEKRQGREGLDWGRGQTDTAAPCWGRKQAGDERRVWGCHQSHEGLWADGGRHGWRTAEVSVCFTDLYMMKVVVGGGVSSFTDA